MASSTCRSESGTSWHCWLSSPIKELQASQHAEANTTLSTHTCLDVKLWTSNRGFWMLMYSCSSSSAWWACQAWWSEGKTQIKMSTQCCSQHKGQQLPPPTPTPIQEVNSLFCFGFEWQHILPGNTMVEQYHFLALFSCYLVWHFPHTPSENWDKGYKLAPHIQISLIF